MVLECATVTGALIGAYLAGVIPRPSFELLFALMMLQSAYFSLEKQEDELMENGDPMANGCIGREVPRITAPLAHYEVINLPGGGALMVVAGLMSGLLGIGSGALKVMAMDYFMHLPLKVSSATSNFMIGVTAGAGALVFLARGDVSPDRRACRFGSHHRRAGRQPDSALCAIQAAKDAIFVIITADRDRDGLARDDGNMTKGI